MVLARCVFPHFLRLFPPSSVAAAGQSVGSLRFWKFPSTRSSYKERPVSGPKFAFPLAFLFGSPIPEEVLKARSRLYRRRYLQANSDFPSFCEICKFCTRHRALARVLDRLKLSQIVLDLFKSFHLKIGFDTTEDGPSKVCVTYLT